MTTTDNLTFLRYNELKEKKIISNRVTLRRWMDREDDPFPSPVALGPNIIAWRRVDVEAWLSRRVYARVREERTNHAINPRIPEMKKQTKKPGAVA